MRHSGTKPQPALPESVMSIEARLGNAAAGIFHLWLQRAALHLLAIASAAG
jgi:hypothetical protein